MVRWPPKGRGMTAAGSALTMIEAVRNLHAVGAALEQALAVDGVSPSRRRISPGSRGPRACWR